MTSENTPKIEIESVPSNETDIHNIPENPWLGRLINGTTMLLIVLISIIIYHVTIVQPSRQRYAVVDVAEILHIKELQVTIMATAPDASDEARARAFDELTTFGKDLEKVLDDLQHECGCSIFVKAAVVKPAAAEDLTPELKRRLGMDATVDELALQLRRAGGRIQEGSK